MNKNKLYEENLYTGIDTIEVKSDTEIDIDAVLDFKPKYVKKDSNTGRCFYKLNTNKGAGTEIYNSTDYYTMRDYMIDLLQMTNPVKVRIDFRVDSFDDNFNELLKLNKLLIMLIGERYKVKNEYYSINPRTLEELCIRIQNDRIEVENYNKGIEEPDGMVKNRLEFRSKKLYDDTDENEKEYNEFMKWCNRLDKSVTKENFEKLQQGLNNALYKQYKNECKRRGFKVNEFLYKYQSSIFTSKQCADLFCRLGYKDPVQQAKRYKQRKSIEYFSYRDLLAYVQMIKDSGKQFFSC
mgnify:CR=1 FL=1